MLMVGATRPMRRTLGRPDFWMNAKMTIERETKNPPHAECMQRAFSVPKNLSGFRGT